MSILRQNNCSINFQKSKFCKKEVKFLGNIISEDGIRPDLSSLPKLENILYLRNYKQLQSLIGVFQWFRPYIVNLSTTIVPLTELLKKKTPFIWSNNHVEIARTVFEKIKNAPMLYHPDKNRPFTIYTDACDNGTGAVIL